MPFSNFSGSAKEQSTVTFLRCQRTESLTLLRFRDTIDLAEMPSFPDLQFGTNILLSNAQ